MYTEEIKQRLDAEPKYRERLFCRGYLLTDAAMELSRESYPFYGAWNAFTVGRYQLLVHPCAKGYVQTAGQVSVALVGHAYNPYTDQVDENDIIKELAEELNLSEKAFFEKLNQLTGVFAVFAALQDKLIGVQDCGGQKMLYFGTIREKLVMTSMPQLAGDIFQLPVDPDITKLLKSKGYFRGSGFLPGNLSPYSALKRLGANTCVEFNGSCFSIRRFFPNTTINEISDEAEKQEKTIEICRVLRKNVELAIRKWPRAALSLTGGMDSKTTLACASDYDQKLFFFSYISKESEKLDADAAQNICRALDLKHHLYQIPDDPADIPDYDFLRKVILHSNSYTCKLHPNELRKYIYLERQKDFDVEIKSDISEIGRAYAARKYYKVKLPHTLAPRHLTISQGRYFLEPGAMHFADKAYKSFMEETGLLGEIGGITMQDLSYWEVRMGAWAATSFASQEYIGDITIPYNNRNLMTIFLQFPEADRREDLPHKRVLQYANPRLAQLDVRVKDSYFGRKRMLLETVYYYYATHCNFYGR